MVANARYAPSPASAGEIRPVRLNHASAFQFWQPESGLPTHRIGANRLARQSPQPLIFGLRRF